MNHITQEEALELASDIDSIGLRCALPSELETLCNAAIQWHIDNSAALAQPEPVSPLSREKMKEILRESGYDTASAKERADFINGIRHGEVARGINRVATCTRHQGWLDVVQEWADRAKEAESKLAQPESVELTDADCTRIYNEANGITDKNPPISTKFIFAAMRAAAKGGV